MPEARLATHAMGCRFELVLCGEDPGFLRAAGEAALTEAEDAHARLSRFAPDSIVSRISRAAGGPPVPVDAELLDLLTLCNEVRNASDGAFDITASGPVRSVLEIDPDASTARLTTPGARIDLGAIGKGFAIDLIIRELAASGVGSAFVHAGGSSIAAFGRGPGGGPGHRPEDGAWRVALPGGGPTIELDGLAFAVSGTEHQPGHIVDPIRGHAARAEGRFAVWGPSAAVCDAWSTAAFVAGVVPPGLPDRYGCVHAEPRELVDARLV